MGQNCIGLERFIVHSSLYDAFIAEMESRIPKMRMGSVLAESDEGFISTVDSGSMISRTRFDELERMIDDAVNEGADLVVGGRRYQHPYFSEGSYFSPTLLGNVSDTMDIAREEGAFLHSLIE
jgi:acyl-CoA reductase-like NAD-dependent aldehyde dehydrogenase